MDLLTTDRLSWTSASPRPELSPDFSISADGLTISGTGNPGCTGMWFRRVTLGAETGARVRVAFDVHGVDNPDYSVLVVVHWLSESGEVLSWDYVSAGDPTSGLRERQLRRPELARTLDLRLILRHSAVGSVRFTLVEYLPKPAPQVFSARIAAVGVPPLPEPTVAGNLATTLEYIDRAAENSPDLMCLAECYITRGPGSVCDRALRIPGPELDALADRARTHRCYVALSAHVAEGPEIYNAGLLINRAGRLVGMHRKTHLTYHETMQGISPGETLTVFDTDIGRLGFLICWELWFPEPAMRLAQADVDLLLFPLAGDSNPRHRDAVWAARAMESGVPLVVASRQIRSTPCRIYDQAGAIVAEGTSESPAAVAELDIGGESRGKYMSYPEGLGEPKMIYRAEGRGFAPHYASGRIAVYRDPDIDEVRRSHRSVPTSAS